MTLTCMIYLLILVYLLFFNRPIGRSFSWWNINLIPFKTIFGYLNLIGSGSMNQDIPITNLLGNLVMLLPLGIYLPYFFKKARKIGMFLLFAFCMTLAIEIIQLLFSLGSFDIDDMILNLVGALAGYGIWSIKPIQRFLLWERRK